MLVGVATHHFESRDCEIWDNVKLKVTEPQVEPTVRIVGGWVMVCEY